MLESQRLAKQVQAFTNGEIASNPLDALQCEWLRLQANPTLDEVFGSPKVDAADAQFLKLAVARKYRFLDNVSVSCENDAPDHALIVRFRLYEVSSEHGQFPPSRPTSMPWSRFTRTSLREETGSTLRIHASTWECRSLTVASSQAILLQPS